LRNRTLGDSFRCAFAGLSHAVRTQRNLRLHLLAALVVLGLAAWARVGAVAAAALTMAVAAVIVSEIINTAIETIIDLISPGYHPLAGLAKNLAAAAVVVAALFAALVGAVILGPPLWGKLVGGR
jgi:diacylglycerol kinase